MLRDSPSFFAVSSNRFVKAFSDPEIASARAVDVSLAPLIAVALVVHQITNAANGTRDAVMYVFTEEDGMLTKLETGATPLPPKK